MELVCTNSRTSISFKTLEDSIFLFDDHHFAVARPLIPSCNESGILDFREKYTTYFAAILRICCVCLWLNMKRVGDINIYFGLIGQVITLTISFWRFSIRKGTTYDIVPDLNTVVKPYKSFPIPDNKTRVVFDREYNSILHNAVCVWTLVSGQYQSETLPLK